MRSFRLLLALCAVAVFMLPSLSLRAQTSTTTPHYIFYANDAQEIIARHSQTGEQKVLLNLSSPLPAAYGFYPSPGAAYLAVVQRQWETDASGEIVRQEYTLYVVMFPDGELLLQQRLLPEGFAMPDEEIGNPGYEMLRSLGEVIWSPDGQKLAFISGQTGDADLAVFDISTRAISTFATPRTATGIIWNPDSVRLVLSDLLTFGSGSGYSLENVYLASLETGSTTAIPLPPDTGTAGVAMIGWENPETLIFSPLDFIVGASGLFTLNLADFSFNTLLLADNRISVPIQDTSSGTLAFVVPDIGLEQSLQPGAYLWIAGDIAPTPLQEGIFYFAENVRDGVFQFETVDGSFLLDITNPLLSPLPASDFGTFVSPVADIVALYRTDGVYISHLSTDDASLVWAADALVPVWSPDGTVFYSFGFTDEVGGLVAVDTVNRQVQLLDLRMAINSPIATAPIP